MASEPVRKSGAQATTTPVSAERWDAMTSIFAAAVPYLRADPMWDSLRSNPSFQTLVGAQR